MSRLSRRSLPPGLGWVVRCVRLLYKALWAWLLRKPKVDRALQLVGATPRRCERCIYWDHEAGQIALRDQNPAFSEAARWLSPDQMSAAKRGDTPPEEGSTFPPHRPDPKKGFIKWSQFGACQYDGSTCTHKDDVCEHWT